MIKNIGIIGSGKAANNFCRNISVNKNFHLFSVFSRNIKHAEVFSKKFNATCYFDNLEDFLSQKNLDIIYIALPTSLHFQYAKKCLEENIQLFLLLCFLSFYLLLLLKQAVCRIPAYVETYVAILKV